MPKKTKSKKPQKDRRQESDRGFRMNLRLDEQAASDLQACDVRNEGKTRTIARALSEMRGRIEDMPES